MINPGNNLIYLDHNATTPVTPEAADIMKTYMEKEFGNPSSSYHLGLKAKNAVEKARGEVASLLGCRSNEIIFTFFPFKSQKSYPWGID